MSVLCKYKHALPPRRPSPSSSVSCSFVDVNVLGAQLARLAQLVPNMSHTAHAERNTNQWHIFPPDHLAHQIVGFVITT